MAGATARQIPVTQDDLDGLTGGGAYAELEVPADYEAVLKKVEDYDKTGKGKGFGWFFVYEVETPSGKTVSFNVYLSFGDASRWKLVQVLQAHDEPLEDGLNSVDPNSLVGDVIGVSIDFPRDEEGNPNSKYREIRGFFSLADPPEEEAAPQNGVTEKELQGALEPMARAAGALEHDEDRDGAKFGEDPAVI